ncbi:sin3 histone deacetylase corepressor complex component SDS3 isoform X2 [Brevipalpus obovatus]|uniref:sin3 histone deacetylase corepressor complex component SDS3 isoform X2 n=1 Tax=Brevipalpus obovatus TaxID=246614 RepID=UPI003D9F77EC
MSRFHFDDHDDDDDDDDYRYDKENKSDEDTEDASETDMIEDENFLEIKEQMYQDKLANLKDQLKQLENGTHPEYVAGVKKLEDEFNSRLLHNETYLQCETERVEREFIRDKKAAAVELEERKVELMGNLIAELEEKKRIAEAERQFTELNSDNIEPRPTITRKLRRRQNDPIPAPEKRKRGAPGQINYLLDERDIMEDLQIINRSYGKK